MPDRVRSAADDPAPFDANHGTLPDAKDATGTTILVEAPMDPSVVTTTAPWAQMQKLVTSYTSCECQPDTFLSMDDVDPAAMGIVNEVASLFTCAQPTTALVAAAQAKDVDQVKTILAGCTLNDDVTPDQFASTTSDIETKVEQTMSGKHVCNNDAQLQADLFTHFRDAKSAPACPIRAWTRTVANSRPCSSAPPRKFTERPSRGSGDLSEAIK